MLSSSSSCVVEIVIAIVIIVIVVGTIVVSVVVSIVIGVVFVFVIGGIFFIVFGVIDVADGVVIGVVISGLGRSRSSVLEKVMFSVIFKEVFQTHSKRDGQTLIHRRKVKSKKTLGENELKYSILIIFAQLNVIGLEEWNIWQYKIKNSRYSVAYRVIPADW